MSIFGDSSVTRLKKLRGSLEPRLADSAVVEMVDAEFTASVVKGPEEEK